MPGNLKTAKVIPIFKSGDNTVLNNYRPISILPAISKVLEKLVCNRLVGFLEENDILYKHQYGFRSKHSTTHPVLQLIKYIADANDKNTKDSLIDSPLKGCSARLVSLSSIIEGDGRMLNCLRGPNILVHYWVILPPSP